MKQYQEQRQAQYLNNFKMGFDARSCNSSREGSHVDLQERAKIKTETLLAHATNLHNGRTQKFTITSAGVAGQTQLETPKKQMINLNPGVRHQRMPDNIKC